MAKTGIKVSHSTLLDWVNNYQQNKTMSFLTESAAIGLTQLENFIADAKRQYSAEFNAVKIYFIRFPLTGNKQNLAKESSKNLSLPSLAFVPLKNANPVTWDGEDFKFDNGEIFLLPFCNPDNPPGNEDETGVCPPKCGGKKSTGP
jgi:hypothetical protein